MIYKILKILGIEFPTNTGYKSKQEKDKERRSQQKVT